MNMRERLSTHPKLNVIPAAVKSLNARHQEHLSSNDIQQSHCVSLQN
jgi:hypothetical protein